jgi:TatD DNase family protein
MIDSHCHIDGDEFAADRDEVLARARAAGVSELVVIGTGASLEAIARAPAFARATPGVHATVGVHPHDAARFPASDWDGLEALARDPGVCAVGEMGLDFYYDTSPREAQAEVFRRQIRLARAVGKPIVCHVRDAHAESLAILREERAAEVGAVIHCFTGNAAEATAYVAEGFLISFSGIVTFKGASAEPIREAARAVPLDRILLETDAPYLAPVPRRGKRNEPAFLPHTAEVVAACQGIAAEALVAATDANTRKFFGLSRGNGA